MLIRTYADIEKLKGKAALSPAEKKLIENCKLGELTTLGDGTRPDGPSPERTIRADLLRYLILGGCEQCRVHEKGVQVARAWIEGQLDLSFAHAKGAVHLLQCAFAEPIVAYQASFDRLVLNGSSLPGLKAENATIRGHVFLDNLNSTGEVSFSGAEIGGQLSCKGAELNGGERTALNAEGATIKGGAFLYNLKSTGEVSFAGAEVGGQISFDGTELNGGEDMALNAQRMIVRGSLFWRNIKLVVGAVDLDTAHLGDLVDDEQSWKAVSSLRLVGVTYEDLAGPHLLPFRKLWLKKGANAKDLFHPQPYQQLAKFYRETGHRYEAREILVAKEIEQRRATRKAIREGKARTESWLIPEALAFLNFLWDRIIRFIAGYGYKPWLSLWWLGGLVATMMFLSLATWTAGDFAPNSAVILTSQDWKTIADGPSENPAAEWTDTLAPGKDYETFYSFAYALDVVVPVLDLGQTDAWAPSPARGDWGYWMFYAQKMFIVAGWVVTAIAAAAISGMIRRDD